MKVEMKTESHHPASIMQKFDEFPTLKPWLTAIKSRWPFRCTNAADVDVCLQTLEIFVKRITPKLTCRLIQSASYNVDNFGPFEQGRSFGYCDYDFWRAVKGSFKPGKTEHPNKYRHLFLVPENWFRARDLAEDGILAPHGLLLENTHSIHNLLSYSPELVDHLEHVRLRLWRQRGKGQSCDFSLVSLETEVTIYKKPADGLAQMLNTLDITRNVRLEMCFR